MSGNETLMLDVAYRKIINELQKGFPIVDSPFDAVGQALGLSAGEVIARLQRLLDEGVLSRFGPMYHAEKLGGGLSLAAMAVPDADFERVAEQVNSFDEVAHNYARDHPLNMWFVLATEKPQQVEETIAAIEQLTGLRVYNMPKKKEFYVGLYFDV